VKPLYEKLARSYADVTQSADAYSFLANVLEKNGDVAGAKEMRKKAFDLEPDPIVKSKLKLNEAFAKGGSRVAALNKARKAQQVDPGSGAGRYIRSYQKNAPSKKEIFTQGVAPGSSHKIGCWIGETVRVPK